MAILLLLFLVLSVCNVSLWEITPVLCTCGGVQLGVSPCRTVCWTKLTHRHRTRTYTHRHTHTQSFLILKVALCFMPVPEVVGGHQLTATVIDLSPWVEYEFRVLASNTIGTGEPSKPSKQARTKGTCMYCMSRIISLCLLQKCVCLLFTSKTNVVNFISLKEKQ